MLPRPWMPGRLNQMGRFIQYIFSLLNSLITYGFLCDLRYQENLCICCLDSGLPNELGKCSDCHGTILKLHGYAKKDSHGVTLKPTKKVCGACAYGENPREYLRKLLRKGKVKDKGDKHRERGDGKEVEDPAGDEESAVSSDYDPLQDAPLEDDDISSIDNDVDNNKKEDAEEIEEDISAELDTNGEIKPENFKRAELASIAKGLGVGVVGTKNQLAERINEERKKLCEMNENVAEENKIKQARLNKKKEKDVLAARRRAILARVRTVRESIAAKRRESLSEKKKKN